MTSKCLSQSFRGRGSGVAVASLFVGLFATAGFAQGEHHHHHSSGSNADAQGLEPPKIFLDKSPRIVEYQLSRLENERLLLVERNTGDPKYAPVYTAILTRAGMSPQHREDALRALVELNQSDEVAELLKALEKIGDEDRQAQRTAQALVTHLLRQPAERLMQHRIDLDSATAAESPLLRSVGYAGLIVAGLSDQAWLQAVQSETITDWLSAVSLVPQPNVRAALRQRIVTLVEQSYPVEIRTAAIGALSFVPADQDKTFELIAPLAADPQLRQAAIRTLLAIAPDSRVQAASEKLALTLVQYAESVPAAERTTDAFIDAMQLADQLLARIPVEIARDYRKRLREITVRVVRIRTVEEEMRYDTSYFAVEAGRPVQIVLDNVDLMPHNLVITMPGALQQVAERGLAVGPERGWQGKQYVPDISEVLHATGMVEPNKQERLTFTAPSEPGEYPYVCTFPRHWMRMYGVMVVTKDLDAWLKNPTEPKDPVGSNRPFVKSWTVADLQGELNSGLRGRSPDIGRRIFTEASCAQCHKMHGQGGTVGPELTDVLTRWKGDRIAVLREILEPSHRIDPKYAVQLILTVDGKSVSGIVTAEDKASVSVLSNPEAKEPVVIPRAEIDDMVRTSVSMMPKALLDRFTQDEIFELLAYLESAQKPRSHDNSEIAR